MARPIEPTPVLKGRNATKLLEEVAKIKKPSSKVLEWLEKCSDLYNKFYSRLQEAK